MSEKNIIEELKRIRLFANDGKSVRIISNAIDTIQNLNAKLSDCDKIVLALKERGISIETIENYIKFEDECVEKGFSFKSLIEAREKQTAKRPYFESDGYSDGMLVYDTWNCPNCGESYEAEYDECEDCPKCGQKIDWKEYEE